jgi:threonine dehydrogenase-like Zn-dependent dehydrogenase
MYNHKANNYTALYLSDVLCTSYHAVKDTTVYQGDEVAIFGAGPIGQMAGVFALGEGASKIIFVDTEPRLSVVKQHFPAEHSDKLVLLDYKKLSHGITSKETVVSKLKEISGGRGPDVAIECAAGEYAKGWMHWLEMAVGAETDTSEILNEMIEGVRNYGRCGITGVYVAYVCTLPDNFLWKRYKLINLLRQTTSTSARSCSEAFGLLETARHRCTNTGTSCLPRSKRASSILCRWFLIEYG